jgi:hypothetical protein
MLTKIPLSPQVGFSVGAVMVMGLGWGRMDTRDWKSPVNFMGEAIGLAT